MSFIPEGAPILSAAAMRQAEQAQFDRGVSQDGLMERAGIAVAREAIRLNPAQGALVLAGPGNNGGDAYVAARHLAQWGIAVTVAALGMPGAGAAQRMAANWTGPTIAFGEPHHAGLVIDGLFGTGVGRPLDPDLLETLAGYRDPGVSLAIDVPSGMDCDAGEDRAQIFAFRTVATGALKAAHLIMPHADDCGSLAYDTIGLDPAAAWRTIKRPDIWQPQATAHKYRAGITLVVGGAMPGAARLAAHAALKAGSGYVVLAGRTHDPAAPAALVQRPIRSPGELAPLIEDDRVGTVLIGPGLGRDQNARNLLDMALEFQGKLVLDGDALALLGDQAAARLHGRETVFLTPHSGEFERMFGTGSGNKIERTVAAARSSGAVIVHKGADTVIARPDGTATVARSSNHWLSTAGTGDVLAGLVAAAIDDLSPLGDAAVWLHGRAARLAGGPLIADDLIDQIPQAVQACLSK